MLTVVEKRINVLLFLVLLLTYHTQGKPMNILIVSRPEAVNISHESQGEEKQVKLLCEIYLLQIRFGFHIHCCSC